MTDIDLSARNDTVFAFHPTGVAIPLVKFDVFFILGFRSIKFASMPVLYLMIIVFCELILDADLLLHFYVNW